MKNTNKTSNAKTGNSMVVASNTSVSTAAVVDFRSIFKKTTSLTADERKQNSQVLKNAVAAIKESVIATFEQDIEGLERNIACGDMLAALRESGLPDVAISEVLNRAISNLAKSDKAIRITKIDLVHDTITITAREETPHTIAMYAQSQLDKQISK